MKKYLLQYKGRNACLLLLLLVYAGVFTGTSMTLAYLVDALAKGKSKEFMILQACQIGLILFSFVLYYVINVYQTYTIQLMTRSLREDYARFLNAHSYRHFKEKSVGDHLSVMNNDIQLIEMKGFDSFYTMIETIAKAVFALVGLTVFDVRIVILTVLLTLVITYLPRPFAKKMEEYMAGLSKANERLMSGLNDQLEGYEALYYAGKKVTFRSQIRTITDFFIRDKMQFTKKTTLVEIVMALISVIGQAIVNIYAGILILRGLVIVGAMITVGNLSAITFNSLTTINQLRVNIASTKALFDKFQVAPEVLDEQLNEDIEEVDIKQLGVAFGENVVFSALDMHLEKGGKYVIIGESGSGKSTLVNVLLGNNKAYVGEVTYNGKDVKNLDENSLIDHIAYIKNTTHIYQDTLRHNLTLFDDEVSEEKLKWALDKVNLGMLWPRLDEQVKADSLSEGQKQRIGIARALLRGKDFIIMDEATANLDYENAKRIEDDLLAQKDLTYLTITHHLREEAKGAFDRIYELKSA